MKKTMLAVAFGGLFAVSGAQAASVTLRLVFRCHLR